MRKILILLTLLTVVWPVEAQRRINFDFEWRFIQDDNPKFAEPDYVDRQWEEVQLPHDWNIKMKFDKSAEGSAAYLPGTVGWYRKSFMIPKSYAGKQVTILFAGIFHQSDVYVNGRHLGFRPYGFCSIEYDLTPYLNIGAENIISVRVNCTG
ncbi:MAG: beta-glycosidase, partial [Candidatus Azobacteroides sp.]|nr:beta-glycosidase [Candidatus Azobacteroides sp.]